MKFFLRITFIIILNGFFLVGFGQGSSQKSSTSLFAGESYWRGVFKLNSGVEVPFNFLVRQKKPGDSRIFLLNADEKFEGGRVIQKDDSVFVLLNQFDNELALSFSNDSLSGVLRRQDKTGTPVPVYAVSNRKDRFTESGTPPAGDITGTYDVRFALPEGKEEKAVGLFTQKGKKLQATFLKITGDSRYLEGVVEGNQFYLSSFIGSGPVYYKGTFTRENKLTGELYGARGSQQFSGNPDENAALPDAYSLTYLKEGYTSVDFSFPDLTGRNISPKDEKYKNKVLIITVGGTWCPNCVDEAAFLAPWYIKNKDRGVEVISLMYERTTDPAYVQKTLTRFKENYNIQYDQLVAGVADKQKVAASLPALNTFLSFPTTIFIGRDGKVAKIHTGFTGPATGKYYQEFLKEFDEEVSLLLK